MFWWLSFVEDGEFQGACVVEARDAVDAVRLAWLYECNPGGQVGCVPLCEGHPFPVNLLMTKADIELFQESPARSLGNILVELVQRAGGDKP